MKLKQQFWAQGCAKMTELKSELNATLSRIDKQDLADSVLLAAGMMGCPVAN